MDFNFTNEQKQLADVLKRFIDKEYTFETFKKLVHSPAGISEKLWKGFVDLGLTCLPIPEEFGGLGGTSIDMLVVMQELGRGLALGPYFATIWGAEIIKRAGNAQQQAILNTVADGTVKLAVALEEPQSRYELFNVKTKAVATENGYIIDGRKNMVVAGGSADYLIISARVAETERSKTGLALFLIPSTVTGLTRSEYRTLDGYRAVDITLNKVSVTKEHLLGIAGTAWQTIEPSADYAIALLCAESVGVMESMLAQTLEYSKGRKQFGQPISKFQSLQHRMVDMFTHVELARSMAYLAAVKISADDRAESSRVISAAKVRIGQAARFIAQQAVQIHGAMGVSDELPLSHYFKRLTTIEFTLGDTDYHLSRFMDLMEKT